MANQWVKARQTKYAAYAATYILVVIAVIVVVNVLADRYNKSYDATANKRYSLSEQTAKIVKGLKQDATITYYSQPNRFREGKDLLSEYSNLSPKVHVEYVDADKERERTMEAGVKNYGTAVVQVGGRKEEAKSMTEEGITGALIRDMKSNTRTVCFLSGSGEHQLDESDLRGLSQFKQLLTKDEYESKSVDLIQKPEIQNDCTAVVVAGPTHDYVQLEVDAIKKYVEDGGRVFFMLDPPLKIGRSDIADNEALTNLLASWGVTLDKDVILDLVSQAVGLGPQVALVTNYSSQPIVEEIRRTNTHTAFPLARSIQIKNTDKTSVQKLFDSSGGSLATTNLRSANVGLKDPGNKKGPLTIAVAGTYNTGKQDSQGRFVVIGSSGWVANGFIPFDGNGDLALDAVNWLASDEDLISIRPKPPENRRVSMTQRQFNAVLVTSQFILPLIVVVAGFGVWWKRR
ncbi:MAG: GldG family protein, partial [Terriglobales bacterium]